MLGDASTLRPSGPTPPPPVTNFSWALNRKSVQQPAAGAGSRSYALKLRLPEGRAPRACRACASRRPGAGEGSPGRFSPERAAGARCARAQVCAQAPSCPAVGLCPVTMIGTWCPPGTASLRRPAPSCGAPPGPARRGPQGARRCQLSVAGRQCQRCP